MVPLPLCSSLSSPAVVSIKQIAEIAEVSPTAVSLILNKKPHRYAETTVQRVEKAAAEHDYFPSSFAQSMHTKRFNAVTLFKSVRQGNAGFDRIAETNFHEELSRHGIRMGIALIDDEVVGRVDGLSFIRRQWQCDGYAFAYNFPGPAPLVSQLKASPFPVVWYNQNYRYDSVFPDNVGGAAGLTRRMIECGHRRIVFVHGRPLGSSKRHHFSVGDRLKGYQREMTARGFAPEVRIVNGITPDEHCEEFRQILRESKDLPTGWIFCGPSQAKSFATAALLEGLRIPDDFSLGTFGIAYDVWSSGLRIQYATEFFDILGRELGRILATKINNPERAIPSVKVPMTLREGCESIVAPRRR